MLEHVERIVMSIERLIIHEIYPPLFNHRLIVRNESMQSRTQQVYIQYNLFHFFYCRLIFHVHIYIIFTNQRFKHLQQMPRLIFQ